MTVDCWRVRGPSRDRHIYRHRENGLGKRFSRRRDGDDAHDDDIRAYSRQGVHLYFLGPYPFTLTRRTRRTEQGAPYLCGFPTYDWRRVCLIALITRRRYPTRTMGCSRVYQEHCRVQVGNPTTRNPLLTLNTVAVVGFVGSCEKI
jgi:hypothetical protein